MDRDNRFKRYCYMGPPTCPKCNSIIYFKNDLHNPIFINGYPSVCENQNKEFTIHVTTCYTYDLVEAIRSGTINMLGYLPKEELELEIKKRFREHYDKEKCQNLRSSNINLQKTS